MYWKVPATFVAAGALLASCASTETVREVAESPRPEHVPVIWSVPHSPSPLGPVHLTPGTSARVSLLGSAFHPIEAIESCEISSNSGVTFEFETNAVTVKAASSEGQGGLLRAKVRTTHGAEVVVFPVVVAKMQMVPFSYTPPAGKKPNRVFVAGEFNGWNQAKDELLPDAQGIFRGEVPIDPGKWTYKFVVDGNWMADPGNPKQDDSGFGNSLLEVAGTKRETFNFRVLAGGMPGAGPQCGFLADLPGASTLDPASVVVLANNKLLENSAYRIGADGRSITLEVPADVWGVENSVTVIAQDDKGRRGELTAPFAFKNAPRSPRDEIIYSIMVDRFADGDQSLNRPSDNAELHPLANYVGGDWAGVRQKIAEHYFERLGVTTLWISPPNRNTAKVERDAVPPHRLFTSYHGYWPDSWTETNEQFGTMDDLHDLVGDAHLRGIAVLLDFVANHVHEDHPVLKEHPDWAVPLDLPDGRKNIRLFDEFPFTTWFDTFLPTLDYENNDEIVEVMAENASWWLKTTGADGFRHDAVKHIPPKFWRALTSRLNQDIVEQQGRAIYQVGETISGRGTITQFVGPDMMNGQFDFPLYFSVENVLAKGKSEMSKLLEEVQRSQAEYPPSAIMSPLIGNHDVIRFMGYADGDIPDGVDQKEIGFKNPPTVEDPASYDRIRLAFAFLLSIPGPPTIYYGDEIGLGGAHDPDNRRPMIWENRDEHQQATFDAVSELTHARQDSVALRRGYVEPLYADPERLVFARIAPEETVVVFLARKPKDGSMTLMWPAHWGKPASVTPIVSRRLRSEARDGGIRLDSEDYGFGLYRVQW
ncbi:hypothetical protein HZA57_03080 [Candidatus Poribacteria bacterium]|nr:hypothetical protein [Candidatus Poribacteria bacterium]